MTDSRRHVVALTVNHGDYNHMFLGRGPDILSAAEDAALQTSYAADLFDRNDPHYDSRNKFREELHAALTAGKPYRGFGWCTFESALPQ